MAATITTMKKASGRTIPVIAGTRIKVSHIYREHVLFRRTPAEIAAAYPVTIADVHAALAYAFTHLPAIKRELREEKKIFGKLKGTMLTKGPMSAHA